MAWCCGAKSVSIHTTETIAEVFMSKFIKILAFGLKIHTYNKKSFLPHDFTDDDIGSVNGLVPSGNKPLPEPVLTKISDVICYHLATVK